VIWVLALTLINAGVYACVMAVVALGEVDRAALRRRAAKNG